MLSMEILTVSQVNFYIRQMFRFNDALKGIYLEGEVSNLVLYNKSGHIYFSLKDEKCFIKAVVFASIARRLTFLPENGLKVIVRGDICVFESAGTYQIYVDYIEPVGFGALNLAFEQLKIKLAKEGLFKDERKKSLPVYPKRVGVITSRSGAVFWDIKTTLSRRAPLIEIFFLPVMVQGDKASGEIIGALKTFNVLNTVDVLVIARGGGSLEDLWPFNNEDLAYAITESKIPVVSAVGHETDFTICDFVADKRAATPTAAAEIVSNGYFNVEVKLHNYFSVIKNCLEDKVLSLKYRLENLNGILKANDPLNKLKDKTNKLDLYYSRLNNAFCKIININGTKLLELKTKLESFNPRKIFELGYAMVLDEKNNSVKSIKDVSMSEKIKVNLLDGMLDCKVLRVYCSEH